MSYNLGPLQQRLSQFHHEAKRRGVARGQIRRLRRSAWSAAAAGIEARLFPGSAVPVSAPAPAPAPAQVLAEARVQAPSAPLLRNESRPQPELSTVGMAGGTRSVFPSWEECELRGCPRDAWDLMRGMVQKHGHTTYLANVSYMNGRHGFRFNQYADGCMQAVTQLATWIPGADALVWKEEGTLKGHVFHQHVKQLRAWGYPDHCLPGLAR